jgi:small subunit ribosomal protein S5
VNKGNPKKGKAPIKEVKEFEEEVIQIDRVTRVVKGGRRLRFRATVVIGNKKGKVGVGIGKSTEVTGAISKAVSKAKKSLVTVPMAGQTIPHRVYTKYKSAKILIMPACPGTGIIAGGPLRKIIELSGIKDILSKSIGCNNRLSNSQAAIKALTLLKPIPWLKIEKPAVEVKPVHQPHQENMRGPRPQYNKPSSGHSQKPYDGKKDEVKVQEPKVVAVTKPEEQKASVEPNATEKQMEKPTN